ncbi:hypothetical protein GXP71_19145 [Cellulomonas sp. H30R-01]|uniref:DUF6174 domain-containing protein n=1 Tax=Cellulomonas sp. H30R-01 TaxID=2704467 RepID=UPI00138C8667|nr:DUF6174 domain-containing protein [Cellulomonas sp. H30R-01]QHT57988.1 hypothetical protein GXP71_19145 [Cellulomonas sp. H30R-01]
MRRATKRWAVGAVVLVATLGGCSGTEQPGPVPGAAEAAERWTGGGVDSYAFSLTSSCGERLLVGSYRVTVTDGAVTAVEGLDEVGRRIAGEAQDLAAQVPTIDTLLDRVVDADASTVPEATFDDAGVPTAVTFDPSPGIDDEECYTVADVDPAA